MNAILQTRCARSRRAFTLVELLVVIAIIGVLVALLLPAIQAAREAARNAQCKNNLRQIALAMLNFESTHKSFPSGGWGFRWMGDPDRGVGPGQPGGWTFQVAPMLEQGNVTFVGKGLTGTAKKAALAEQRATVVGTFYCPSRRAPVGMQGVETTHNADIPATEGKTDYAANGGNNSLSIGGGPAPNFTTLSDCLGGFPNCDWASGRAPSDVQIANLFRGIVTSRTGAKIRQVSDGTSNTLMLGEKSMDQRFYSNVTERDLSMEGNDNPGDNSSAWQGYDQDTVRWPAESRPPIRHQLGTEVVMAMGGPHASAINGAMCDGSVHAFAYDIDPVTWNNIAIRDDGQTVDLP